MKRILAAILLIPALIVTILVYLIQIILIGKTRSRRSTERFFEKDANIVLCAGFSLFSWSCLVFFLI